VEFVSLMLFFPRRGGEGGCRAGAQRSQKTPRRRDAATA